MTAAAKTVSNESVSWDAKLTSRDYQQPLSSAPTPTVIPKTVDYGHGHGISSKYKHI